MNVFEVSCVSVCLCVCQVQMHFVVDGITAKTPLQQLVPEEPMWAQTGISFKGLLGSTVFVLEKFMQG